MVRWFLWMDLKESLLIILRENNSSQEKYYRQFVEWYSAADWDSVDW